MCYKERKGTQGYRTVLGERCGGVLKGKEGFLHGGRLRLCIRTAAQAVLVSVIVISGWLARWLPGPCPCVGLISISTCTS